jgi:hypothetical protein
MGRAGMLSYNSFINSVFMTVAALSRRRKRGLEDPTHLRKPGPSEKNQWLSRWIFYFFLPF